MSTLTGTDLILRAQEILKCISAQGMTVTMFISVLLTYRHFHDEKLKLESAISQKPTHDTPAEAVVLHHFVFDSSTLVYSQEAQGLMGTENGLHLSAHKARVDQLVRWSVNPVQG
jgi:hypothetical protein